MILGESCFALVRSDYLLQQQLQSSPIYRTTPERVENTKADLRSALGKTTSVNSQINYRSRHRLPW